MNRLLRRKGVTSSGEPQRGIKGRLQPTSRNPWRAPRKPGAVGALGSTVTRLSGGVDAAQQLKAPFWVDRRIVSKAENQAGEATDTNSVDSTPIYLPTGASRHELGVQSHESATSQSAWWLVRGGPLEPRRMVLGPMLFFACFEGALP